MVRKIGRIKDPMDGLNRNKHRTFLNTDKQAYNCGGYALGTFSWYCPHGEDMDFIWNSSFSVTKMKKITRQCTSYMLKDFPDMRRIRTLKSLKKNEYAIAFRLSSYGDFHFAKLSRNGRWYHKRGNCPWIENMSTEEIFNTDWCDCYDGPIVLFAKQRT